VLCGRALFDDLGIDESIVVIGILTEILQFAVSEHVQQNTAKPTTAFSNSQH